MVDRRPKNKERQGRAENGATEKDISADPTRFGDSASSDVPDPTQVLATLIEVERTELTYVHSILRMLYDVLLYSDDDDASMHADVAQVCSIPGGPCCWAARASARVPPAPHPKRLSVAASTSRCCRCCPSAKTAYVMMAGVSP